MSVETLATAEEQKARSAKLRLVSGQASLAAPVTRPQHKPLFGVTDDVSTSQIRYIF